MLVHCDAVQRIGLTQLVCSACSLLRARLSGAACLMLSTHFGVCPSSTLQRLMM